MWQLGNSKRDATNSNFLVMYCYLLLLYLGGAIAHVGFLRIEYIRVKILNWNFVPNIKRLTVFLKVTFLGRSF